MRKKLVKIPYNANCVYVSIYKLELSEESNILIATVEYTIACGDTVLSEDTSQIHICTDLPGCLHIGNEDYDIVECDLFEKASLSLENNPEWGNIPLMEIFDELNAFMIKIN